MENVVEVLLKKNYGTLNDDHKVALKVFECGRCFGALGVDVTYLDQMSKEIKCPYCEYLNEVE